MCFRLARYHSAVTLLALIAGCTTQNKVATSQSVPAPQSKSVPIPHLQIVTVDNYFNPQFLPNAIEIELKGHAVYKYALELALVEKGEMDETATLDVRSVGPPSWDGGIRLILSSRPDPEANPRGPIPPDQEVFGFSMATRIAGSEPESFDGPFEVWGKRRSSTQLRRPGAIDAEKTAVLLVQWFGPTFGEEEERGFRDEDPPPTLDAILKRSVAKPKMSAMVLLLRWSPR